MKSAAMQDDNRRPRLIGLSVNTQKFTTIGLQPLGVAIENAVDNFVGETRLTGKVGFGGGGLAR